MSTTWKLDPSHSEATFKVRHLMISSVKGEFQDFDATIVTTDDNSFENAKVTADIKAHSIATNNADRDTHLKSADFFSVEEFPHIHFESTSFEKVGGDDYKLTGNLTIKGNTNKVVFDVEFGGEMKDPYGNAKAGFSLNGKINRKDFGLTWNQALETGGVMVSDEVKLAAEAQFVKS